MSGRVKTWADKHLKGRNARAPSEEDVPRPEQGTSQPERDAPQPEQGASQPKRDVLRPEQGTSQPEQNAPRAEQEASQPKRDALQPEQGASQPEQDAPQPEQGTLQSQGDSPRPEGGEQASGVRREEHPSPGTLARTSWKDLLKRTFREFKEDNLTDWAAALTYYAVLSIFPAMLVIISLIGLGGASLSESIIRNVGDLAPGAVRDVLATALTELQRGAGAAGLVAVIGLVAAVWSASGYVAAFMRASNAIYDLPEGRPIWKTLPIRIAVTLVSLTLLSASAIAVVISGPLARKAGDLLGLGDAAVTVWNIAKWPVLLVAIAFLFALLYWASPNAKRGFTWVTPGGLLALAVWLLASVGFAFYVANFGSYNKTYGSLAGVIIFLVWLWISNIALLLGVELNAELQRARAIARGLPPDREPYVQPRDTRKFPEELRREVESQEHRLG
ncbi:YihY/virulence factor BrkB family protein [Thermomonospora curvata]|uniref:Ribonuclease BN n=1 Tax=Thermomonospora curvata (strain ATCC 19995 / DSM 43183 / JCM 3096 / KCTC 9072 / NBRC 15933 / NCIMB 10081 / Henssen B9) TaxID=471852 RepID=D1A9B2_THECD|nr:YhjD/YihY/BrkB family envelope integrity protein [Thermomonospora curvata]ACY96808.1 ribonuclease BN [Thermomonospora curvata DSM 43183]